MDDEKKVASIDKTVSDYRAGDYSWILNSHECVKDINFKLDLGKISFNVAMSCLTLLNSTLRKNMAERKLDGLLNYSDGHSNEWTIDPKSLTESVQYAILYWSDHFVDAVKMVDAYQQEQLLVELKRFCKTQLLHYLEAILLLKKLDLVSSVVNSVLSCLADIHHPDTPSILQDLKLVSINFRPQLMVSPLQVYNHALISVPQQTEYYLNYHQMTSARITIGAKKNWGPLNLFGQSEVVSVAISPDGRTIVSGSSDNTVEVWDMQKGICTASLVGHTSLVHSVAISADGRTIVSGSSDNTVRVWDMQEGICTAILDDDCSEVHSVAISPDGRTIVFGSFDSTIRVWDRQNGTSEILEGHSRGVKSVAISPDGRTIVSGSGDSTVRLWDMQEGTCTDILGTHSVVTSVAISPDGRTIVSGSEDSRVRLS
ncbi:WD40-repeat-containing domain protein [Chytriomyces cf. hyalinus JEL632]|nr:WD40-repeat-containing domain protein [Chytriomyces cf. hyalinus JEL632]